MKNAHLYLFLIFWLDFFHFLIRKYRLLAWHDKKSSTLLIELADRIIEFVKRTGTHKFTLR
ncbi:MAG: hypothetical protein COA57_13740 [Flavobacteriales bacterium]|nr:MAG: hypothetical protein COA57_13740 [Flavobacteriales bacterium]